MALNSSVQLPPPSEKRLIKTALHQAVLDCRLHQVRLLVDKHGASVDTKDIHGRTPLMLACLLENEEQGFRMARIFLRAGACLNLRDGLGRTALSYAAMNGREDIVREILKEDVLDINEPDNDGNTPLHHACSSGKPGIVEQLVETFAKFGLNVDRRNKLGYTPLLLACKLGHYVSAHLLITIAKASPTLRDSEFYLNAAEWTQRSHQIQVTVANTARGTSAPVAASTPHSLSFSRESSMYRRPWTPQCCHVKSQRQDAISYSIGSVLRLPALLPPPPTSARSGVHRSEVFIDGKEAREVLLDVISECEAKQRPASTRTTCSRWSHPPTANLLALTRRSRTSVVQDIVSLFRLYSDQYQPAHWRTRMPVDDRHRRHVIIASPAETASEAESPIEVTS